jgi:hypothetical protein
MLVGWLFAGLVLGTSIGFAFGGRAADRPVLSTARSASTSTQ